MKAFALLLLLGGFVFAAYAGDKAANKDFGFAKHSAEISVTPNASYHFYNKGTDGDFYENRYPFMGFAFGAQYMYRPLALFAVSTGLNLHMQALLWRQKAYIPKEYVAQRTFIHTGYLMLPVYFHLFKRMPNSVFEFAIGPDFYFPVFQRAAGKTFDFNGDEVDSGTDMVKFNAEQMRRNAVMGLSIFLGAQLYLCKKADLFLGPHIAFLDLVRLNKDIHDSRPDWGGFYNVYLGLKLGFRLHGAGKQEASR